MTYFVYGYWSKTKKVAITYVAKNPAVVDQKMAVVTLRQNVSLTRISWFTKGRPEPNGVKSCMKKLPRNMYLHKESAERSKAVIA